MSWGPGVEWHFKYQEQSKKEETGTLSSKLQTLDQATIPKQPQTEAQQNIM